MIFILPSPSPSTFSLMFPLQVGRRRQMVVLVVALLMAVNLGIALFLMAPPLVMMSPLMTMALLAGIPVSEYQYGLVYQTSSHAPKCHLPKEH
jgi:hypothetical protein